MASAFCFSAHILIIDYFFPEGRWGEDVLHSIFGMRPFMRSAHADHGASIPTANSGGLDASYLCRRFQLRSGVYASDCGQRHIDPTIASLILSLESVISVLAGWVILGQKLTVRELIGCILVFCAIILAQLPQKRRRSKKRRGVYNAAGFSNFPSEEALDFIQGLFLAVKVKPPVELHPTK